ncbi:MAG: HipA domain-containing protein [Rhabdochlamydiaceae bacterium]|jgi:hypothetical protein
MLCYKCSKPIAENEKTFSGLHEACFIEWFNLRELVDFSDVISKSSSSNDLVPENHNSFFHGKFKKYSAVLNERNYILKVQEQAFPELPATEYLCNQLARHLGLKVPDFFLIRFQGTIETFVCENFMQNHTSSNLIHIYHFLEPSPDNFNCEVLLSTIANKTQRIEEIERFIELTLFDALIGNHDRHGRNLALIESTNGFQLSPFYDNPSYLGIETELLLSAHHEPRGQIYTAQSKEPKIRDYVKEWERLGQIATVNKFRERIDINSLMKIIDASYISFNRKLSIKRLIERRYLELIS